MECIHDEEREPFNHAAVKLRASFYKLVLKSKFLFKATAMLPFIVHLLINFDKKVKQEKNKEAKHFLTGKLYLAVLKLSA